MDRGGGGGGQRGRAGVRARMQTGARACNGREKREGGGGSGRVCRAEAVVAAWRRWWRGRAVGWGREPFAHIPLPPLKAYARAHALDSNGGEIRCEWERDSRQPNG